MNKDNTTNNYRDRIKKIDFQLDKMFDLEIEEEISDEEFDLIYDKLFFCIGYIITIFNSLEELINHCMDAALDPQLRRTQINYLLISKMSYSEKLDFVIKHYAFLVNIEPIFVSLKPKLSALETNLREAATIRNRYAHGSFNMIHKGHYVKVKTKGSKDGVFYDYMRFNSGDLDSNIDFILKARNDLESFEEEYWDIIFDRK